MSSEVNKCRFLEFDHRYMVIQKALCSSWMTKCKKYSADWKLNDWLLHPLYSELPDQKFSKIVAKLKYLDILGCENLANLMCEVSQQTDKGKDKKGMQTVMGGFREGKTYSWKDLTVLTIHNLIIFGIFTIICNRYVCPYLTWITCGQIYLKQHERHAVGL